MKIENLRVAGAALAAVSCVSHASAQAGPEKVTPLAVDGWSVIENGEADTDGGYSVYLDYAGADFEFSVGCTLGYGVNVSWKPQAALTGGILVPVTFSINGDALFTHDVANNDRGDYSWLERGESSDAATLVYAIWEKDKGTLTIEGGGASSTIPFNESENGFWSEQVLFACGLL
ncbi:hypothetical protein [Henriciella litoralis]|uniref:hypothetical protein n=1 Tax=Henriciella litoralis TaxID=568102 RepID=UPI0009FE00C0|nr:hypothetical protein [Henriciella litoralis]